MTLEGKKTLVVSLHDAHPDSWPLIEEQVQLLDAWGVRKTSILVVPLFHHRQPTGSDSFFCQDLGRLQNNGHELVLHGYTHDRRGQREAWKDLFWTRFYTNHEAEFLTLSDAEARARLEKGMRLFSSQGWRLKGFVAPAWLFPERLLAVLKDLGFAYTTRLGSIIRLQKSGPPVRSQSLCYSTRAPWRRSVSKAWNVCLYQRVSRQPCLRLSLHPEDLRYDDLRGQIERLVKSALQDGFEPVTYADYVEG
jgi:predicted deacetylase